MSIVVAVKKNNKIIIAADSLYTAGSQKVKSKYKVNNQKLLQIGNSWIGLVGWTAIEHALESVIQKHKEIFNFSDRSSIYESSLKLQDILEDEYHLETKENDDQPVSSSQLSGLIANKNGIFELDSYREVNEYSSFWAVGSGSRYALGSLYSTYEKLDDAEEIAELAVKAACEFNDACELPLTKHLIQLD